MRTHVMRTVHDRRREIDPVSKLVVAVIAILFLLIATYYVIDYAARVDEAQRTVTTSLPYNYRDTLKAMLVSSGNACPAVCDVASSNGALKVSCDTRQTTQVCAVTRSYTLTLAPSPEPSR